MLIATDASTLIGELPRRRSRRIFDHSDFDFVVAAHAWRETLHELPRRLASRERHGHSEPGGADRALQDCLGLAATHIRVVAESEYAALEEVAKRRVPRDENDWPTDAVAMSLGAGIWTADADFLGCGVATWTTETLLLHLDP